MNTYLFFRWLWSLWNWNIIMLCIWNFKIIIS